MSSFDSLRKVFNEARQIKINGITYFDLYDIGYNLGYKKWDGKTYDKYGKQVEIPNKSRITELAKRADVDLLEFRNMTLIIEPDVNAMILSSKTAICKEIKRDLVSALIEIDKNGFYIGENATNEDINNAINKSKSRKGDK